MQYTKAHSVREIAELINCEFRGDESISVTGHNEIHVVCSGEIVFVDHPKYYDKALHSAASVVLINKDVECPEGKALLISDDPFRDFNKLTKLFGPKIYPNTSIDPSAVVAPSAIIMPGAIIGANCSIGANTVIHSNATLVQNVHVGSDCIIQANAVLGSDAFYYKRRPEGYDPLITGGRTVIADKVDIGAGCTVDRGVTGDTRIGYGTKIDNVCHIGHDTSIGDHCLIAARVTLAGCVVVENEVTLWGGTVVSSDVKIGSKAVILGASGVTKDLEGGKTYFGVPAQEARNEWKEKATLRRLSRNS